MRRKLRDTLARHSYDIVVLSGNVTNDGALGFDNGKHDEQLSAKGLESLLERSGTQLVVLATCNSVPLAAQLARSTNMIAATASIEVKRYQAWNRLFFQLLGDGTPISDAYRIAAASVDIPLAIILNRDAQFV